MTKILNIITRLNIAGGSYHVIEISRLFNDAGHSSTILYGNVEPDEKDMLYLAREHQIPMINIPSMGRSISPWQDLMMLYKVYRTIKEQKPDIVHTHTAKAGFAGRIAARLAGVPVILHTFHGNNFSGYFGWMMTQVSLNLERFLARLCTRIIAISEQQKQALLDYKICSAKKITVIPLGFDINRIVHTDSDLGMFKAAYNIHPDMKIVALVGRLAAIKNPFLFLEIAKAVLAKYEGVVFAFVGDGEMAEPLKTAVLQAGLMKKILFTGFIHDLKPLYADLDILLLTSMNEGTPVAIIEAMANRVPVVSSRVGGIPNMITQGESGFMYPLADQDAFVETIVNILESPQKYQSMVENAFRVVSDKFSSQSLKENLGSLFNQLLHQG